MFYIFRTPQKTNQKFRFGKEFGIFGKQFGKEQR